MTLLLVAALLLGAQAFIIGSSRTLYQMSRDGLLIRQCARVNRRGVPVGSMVFDATVTLALLLMFQARLIDIVAAANVGYLVVFVLLPLAWLRLRRTAAIPGVFQLSYHTGLYQSRGYFVSLICCYWPSAGYSGGYW